MSQIPGKYIPDTREYREYVWGRKVLFAAAAALQSSVTYLHTYLVWRVCVLLTARHTWSLLTQHTSVPLFWSLFWHSVSLYCLPACLPACLPGEINPFFFLSLLQHIEVICEVTISLSLSLMGSYLCSVCTYKSRWYCEFFLLISCGCCNLKENFFGVCDEIGFFFFNFFFWRFLSGWVGNHHPWEDLAKFGYSSERTLELFWISSFLWWHGGTCCLNMAISVSFSSKYVKFGSCVF